MDANEQLRTLQEREVKPSQNLQNSQQEEELKRFMQSIEEAKNKLDNEKAAFEEQRYLNMFTLFFLNFISKIQ